MTPARIKEAVAAAYRVPPVCIDARSRGTRTVAEARQVAMWATAAVLGLSHGAVGRAFGRERTTVLHACQRVDRFVAESANVRARLAEASMALGLGPVLTRVHCEFAAKRVHGRSLDYIENQRRDDDVCASCRQVRSEHVDPMRGAA